MTDSNPYAPPASRAGKGPPVPVAAASAPRSGALEQLRRSRPWVVLLAVLGFVAAGLLASVALFVGVGAADDRSLAVPEKAALVLLAAFLAIVSGLITFVAVLAFRYARAIVFLAQFARDEELEEALDAQRRVWKGAGVAVVLSVAIAVVCAILAAGFAVAW